MESCRESILAGGISLFFKLLFEGRIDFVSLGGN